MGSGFNFQNIRLILQLATCNSPYTFILCVSLGALDTYPVMVDAFFLTNASDGIKNSFYTPKSPIQISVSRD